MLLSMVLCISCQGLLATQLAGFTFEPTGDIFVRRFPFGKYFFIAHLKLNVINRIKLPIQYSIEKITSFPATRANGTEQYFTHALQDLNTSRPLAPHPKAADGACIYSKVANPPLLRRYFCIHSHAGYFYATFYLPQPAVGYVRRYEVAIRGADQNKITAATTLKINAVSFCYPVDVFYTAVLKNCVSTVVVAPHKTTAQFFVLDVEPNFFITNIRLKSFFLTDGTYELHLRSSSVDIVQRFQHRTDLNKFQPVQTFYPRVYGKKNLNIILQNILKTKNPNEKLEISINKLNKNVNVLLNNVTQVQFFGTSNLTRQNVRCRQEFVRWKDSFEMLTKRGGSNIECATDNFMFYNQMQILGYLKIQSNGIFYFQQKVTLTCEAFNVQPTINWYKDDVLIRAGAHALIIDNKRLNEQGEYYCAATSHDIRIASNKIQVKYQDVFTTTFELVVSPTDFYATRKIQGETILMNLLKEKVQSELVANEYVKFAKSLQAVTVTTSEQNVLVTIFVQTQLKSHTSKISFYESIAVYNTIFSPFPFPSTTVTVFDSEYCLSEKTNEYSSYGTFRWNFTKVGTRSNQTCNYGNQKAYRTCISQSSDIARWKYPDLSKCEYGNKNSKIMKQLIKNMTSDISSTSNQMRALTTNATSLTTDDIGMVMDTLSKVALNVTPVKVWSNLLGVASNIMKVNKTILRASRKNKNFFNDLVTFIEGLTDSVIMRSDKEEMVQVSTFNIAAASIKRPKNKFGGMYVSVNNNSSASTFAVSDTLNKFNTNTFLNIDIPKTIYNDTSSKSEKKINIVYFTEPTFFRTNEYINETKNILVSDVFSISLAGARHVNLSENIKWSIKLQRKERQSLEQYSCVYWDIQGLESRWSSGGCQVMFVVDDVVTCSCNHMTSFAVLFNTDFVATETSTASHELALTLITYIGCIVSIVCIAITVTTLLLFRFMRQSIPSQILLGLCISLGMLMLLFVTLVDRTQPKWLCTFTSASIHYFLLTTFCWMLFEAITLYLKVVKVMGEYGRCFVCKAWMFSCGIPAVLVAIFMNLDVEDYNNDKYCIVQGDSFKYGLFTPICITILFNAIIFIRVVLALRKQNIHTQKISNSMDLRRQVRIAISCCFLLGLTWIFGILAISDARLTFQYLFCIFNSLQGLFIFYFNIFRQPRVREAWLNLVMRNKLTTGSSFATSTFRTKTTSNVSPSNFPKCSLDAHRYSNLSVDNNVLNLNRLSCTTEISFSSYMGNEYMKQ